MKDKLKNDKNGITIETAAEQWAKIVLAHIRNKKCDNINIPKVTKRRLDGRPLATNNI